MWVASTVLPWYTLLGMSQLRLSQLAVPLFGSRKLSVGPDQLLLRGSLLRNTKWVYGLVVYTGHESKLMKNSTSAPLKRSSVDKLINKQTLILFLILLVLCLISASCSEWWTSGHGGDWYLALDSKYSLSQRKAINIESLIEYRFSSYRVRQQELWLQFPYLYDFI